MDIKLIDGLKVLECHNELTLLGTLLVVICIFSMIGSIVAFIIFFGKVINMSICAAMIFASIFIMNNVYEYNTVTKYQVMIDDEQKCTYQDIINNYKVTDQNGLIYTIELEELEDNE